MVELAASDASPKPTLTTDLTGSPSEQLPTRTDQDLPEDQLQIQRLRHALGATLIGQEAFVDRLLVGLLTGGHLLIEGVPGLAKTLAARTLAQLVGWDFARLQFTPDLLPADLIGTEVYRPESGDFEFRRGPMFTQVLLVDEINRAPAKVQSALLEAMEENQITYAGHTYSLPTPFWVLATQNPIEQEGTYPLPEAQVDRFLLKLLVTYPERAEEQRILQAYGCTESRRPAPLNPVINSPTLSLLQEQVRTIYLDEKIEQYILDMVRATRPPDSSKDRPWSCSLVKETIEPAIKAPTNPAQSQTGAATLPDFSVWFEIGASPRAALALARASRAVALLRGRHFVVPHDVKSIAHDVLRHRLRLSYHALASGQRVETLLDQLLAECPVP